jgi:hypothetical protein
MMVMYHLLECEMVVVVKDFLLMEPNQWLLLEQMEAMQQR